jgi:hypothetical protein
MYFNKTSYFALVICLITTIFLCDNIISQKQAVTNYRRSSLHIILVGSEFYPNKEVIEDAFRKAPFPDKYNDHRIKFDSLDWKKYYITDEDRNKHSTIKSQKGRLLLQAGGEFLDAFGSLAGGSQTSVLRSDEEKDNDETHIKVFKFMEKNNSLIAKSLIAKWYNYNGFKFNMNLIRERGFYNASQLEFNIADKTVRGSAILGDAGELLINNTYVMLIKFKYYKNYLDLGIDAINTKNYLYQLEWNDSIQDVFYNKYYNNPDEFDETELFNMKYIGNQSSGLIVSPEFDGNKEEYLRWMVVSCMDYAISRLQVKFDVFKPTVPVLSDKPITAYIGMKEGLKGGEKFDVFELVQDPTTSRLQYKKVGSVRVHPTKVWDNRYSVADKNFRYKSTENETNETTYEKVDKTYFEGSVNQSAIGLFLRQVK